MSEHRKSRSSRSSSSRSSSRRSSSSSSRGGLTNAGKAKQKTIGQRLLEMAFGVLVGGALLAGLVWYFFIREPVEYVQRREDIENSVITGTIDPIRDFETIRDTGTVGDMKSLLLALNDWPRDAIPPVKVDFQKKRIEISDKILEHENRTNLHREMAATAKLDALGAWYGLDYENNFADPLIAEKYQAACKGYEKDEDVELRREAFLGKAKALIFEYCKGKWNGTFAHVENSLLELPKQFPEDAYVLSNINLLMSTLQQSKEKESMELYRKLVTAYDGMKDPQVIELRRRLSDVVLLYEAGVSKLISGNWNTPENKVELYNELSSLAKNPRSGSTVIRQIGFAVNGFEKVSDYEYARKICEDLRDNLGSRPPEVDELAAFIAKDGLQRLSSLNQPWSFAGKDARGRAIDPDQFTDKVVVVLYWSPRKSRLASSQFQLLEQLGQLVAPSGVRFVTVQIEEVANKDVQANPAWTNILSTEKDRSGYMNQCPVNRVPYFIIIGRDGLLKELHVPYEELKTKIDFYSRRD